MRLASSALNSSVWRAAAHLAFGVGDRKAAVGDDTLDKVGRAFVQQLRGAAQDFEALVRAEPTSGLRGRELPRRQHDLVRRRMVEAAQ